VITVSENGRCSHIENRESQVVSVLAATRPPLRLFEARPMDFVEHFALQLRELVLNTKLSVSGSHAPREATRTPGHSAVLLKVPARSPKQHTRLKVSLLDQNCVHTARLADTPLPSLERPTNHASGHPKPTPPLLLAPPNLRIQHPRPGPLGSRLPTALLNKAGTINGGQGQSWRRQ